ncbi:MAG: nucleotidyltransferase domain-containing protein [Sulfuricaulis sp.]
MTHPEYGLYLYGSGARGDALDDSDVDVLVVFGSKNTMRGSNVNLPHGTIPIGKKPDLSFYSLDRLRNMYRDGHLFAWHLHTEARFLGEGHDYLSALGKPDPYSSVEEDVSPLRELLSSIKDAISKSPESLIYEAGLLYVCARNIAMCLSYDSPRGLTFSAYAPYWLANSDNPFPIPRKRYELLRRARLAGTRGVAPLPIHETTLLLDIEATENWAHRELKSHACRSNMKRQFVRRVEAERKVLRIINGASKQPSLNGLSKAAIDMWKTTNPHATKWTTDILIGIAKRVQIDTDTSRDVFGQTELKALDTVEGYLIVLERELRGQEIQH